MLHSAHGRRPVQEGDSQEAEVRVSGGGAAAGCLCPQEALGPWEGRERERGGGGGERERGRERKTGQVYLSWFLQKEMGEAGQTSLSLASLNNFSRL